MGKFTNTVRSFNKESMNRFRLVAQTSVLRTVQLAQTVREEGGRMPIKTGFLRASIQAALGTRPRGPTTAENYRGEPQVTGMPVSLVILQWNPQVHTSLFIGWTANYARHREAIDAFMLGAAEQWDITVKNAVKKVGG